MGTYKATEVEPDKWEHIKQMLDEEMLPGELQKALYLVGDKLGQEYFLKQTFSTPSELLTSLENTMSHKEALTVMKHVLGSMQYHEEHSNRSFVKIIEDYERKLDQVNIHHDDEFIGRHSDIETLCKILSKPQNQGLWIYGFGGLGKTTLANKLCSLLRYTMDVDVIHVDLKQRTTVCGILLSILAHFNEVSTDSSFEILMQKTMYHIGHTDKDTCLYLDNFEDIYIMQENKLLVDSFICGLLQGSFSTLIRLIITSRTRPGIRNNNLFEHQLQPPAIEHAGILLQRLCRPIDIPESKRSDILTMCGNNPFAIRVVSRSIQDCQDFLDSGSVLQERLVNVVQHKMDNCIKYAYKTLEENSQLLLRALAVFKTAVFDITEARYVLDIPQQDMSIFLMHFTHRQLVQTIHCSMESTKRSLQTSHEAKSLRFKYSFHPLILKYLESFDRTDTQKIATIRICRMLLLRYKEYPNIDENFQEVVLRIQKEGIMPKILVETLVINETGLETLNISLKENRFLSKITQQVFTNQSKKKAIVSKLADKCHAALLTESYFFWKIEQVKNCIESNDDNLAAAELNEIEHSCIGSIGMSDSLLQADYLITKARCLRRKHKYSIAIDCLQNSLDVLKTSIHPQIATPSIAFAYNALGNIYHDMKEYERALEHHKLAEEKLKAVVQDGYNHELSVYTFNVGTIAAAKGEQLLGNDERSATEMFELALIKYNESMECDTKLNLRFLPNYALKLKIRSRVLVRLNQFEKAYADATEALHIRKKAYGDSDVNANTTRAHHHVGWVLMQRLIEERKNDSVSKSVLQRRRKEAIDWFRNTEEEIRKGEFNINDDGAQAFIDDYKDIAFLSGNTKFKKEVDQFAVEFQTNFESSSSDSTDPSSEAEDESTSSDDATEISNRKDSGIADSISSAETLSAHAHDESTNLYFPHYSRRSSSQVDEVFMESEEDTVGYTHFEKCEAKRKRSSDSD